MSRNPPRPVPQPRRAVLRTIRRRKTGGGMSRRSVGALCMRDGGWAPRSSSRTNPGSSPLLSINPRSSGISSLVRRANQPPTAAAMAPESRASRPVNGPKSAHGRWPDRTHPRDHAHPTGLSSPSASRSSSSAASSSSRRTRSYRPSTASISSRLRCSTWRGGMRRMGWGRLGGGRARGSWWGWSRPSWCGRCDVSAHARSETRRRANDHAHRRVQRSGSKPSRARDSARQIG